MTFLAYLRFKIKNVIFRNALSNLELLLSSKSKFILPMYQKKLSILGKKFWEIYCNFIFLELSHFSMLEKCSCCFKYQFFTNKIIIQSLKVQNKVKLVQFRYCKFFNQSILLPVTCLNTRINFFYC